MEVTFIGSGDAFGSGGRLQPCIMVKNGEHCFTFDFGLSALIGLKQQQLSPNAVDTIILSHLHGDHCGGIPFLLMDAMLGAKREAPLRILGPEGTEHHLSKMHEILFPGSSVMTPKFSVDYIELSPGDSIRQGDLTITAIEAMHTLETKPLATRVESNGKSIVYTGDGACTEELVNLTAGADLLIAESYFFDKPVKWHLNYPDISLLKAKKTVLTHMSDNMLRQKDNIPELCAYDGMKIKI